MLWAYRGSFISIYLGGRNYETRKGGINGAQRDPDRHDGWFQGSLTKDENLDRAQKIWPPDKSVHWKAIFSILILIQKTFAVGTQKNSLNETVLLSSLNTCFILVRKTYVVGTQKNHLTEMVPLSTQKHMPNIGEKNIPIYVKAKQTRNKSKIKVKQSKAEQVKSKLG